jgi:hypothetical protein
MLFLFTHSIEVCGHGGDYRRRGDSVNSLTPVLRGQIQAVSALVRFANMFISMCAISTRARTKEAAIKIAA